MNAAPTLSEVLAGGFGALLGPGLALPACALLLAGITFGSLRRRSGQLATAAVLVFVFSAATTRRGLADLDGAFTDRLVALGILLLLSWVVARHEEGRFPWFGLLCGLLLAGLAVEWRLEAYGPVLGALRGSWQQAPDFARLFPYHLATGIGLAGIYLLGSELGRALPRRPAIGLWWAVSLAAAVLIWTGAWAVLEQTLLLRWPFLPLG